MEKLWNVIVASKVIKYFSISFFNPNRKGSHWVVTTAFLGFYMGLVIKELIRGFENRVLEFVQYIINSEGA